MMPAHIYHRRLDELRGLLLEAATNAQLRTALHNLYHVLDNARTAHPTHNFINPLPNGHTPHQNPDRCPRRKARRQTSLITPGLAR